MVSLQPQIERVITSDAFEIDIFCVQGLKDRLSERLIEKCCRVATPCTKPPIFVIAFMQLCGHNKVSSKREEPQLLALSSKPRFFDQSGSQGGGPWINQQIEETWWKICERCIDTTSAATGGRLPDWKHSANKTQGRRTRGPGGKSRQSKPSGSTMPWSQWDRPRRPPVAPRSKLPLLPCSCFWWSCGQLSSYRLSSRTDGRSLVKVVPTNVTAVLRYGVEKIKRTNQYQTKQL